MTQLQYDFFISLLDQLYLVQKKISPITEADTMMTDAAALAALRTSGDVFRKYFDLQRIKTEKSQPEGKI